MIGFDLLVADELSRSSGTVYFGSLSHGIVDVILGHGEVGRRKGRRPGRERSRGRLDGRYRLAMHAQSGWPRERFFRQTARVHPEAGSLVDLLPGSEPGRSGRVGRDR